MSICSEPMRELSNPGASGSIFYLTQDDEFILKTVSMKEAEFLQKLMPGYYMNLQQNKNTTLPKFFGMFCYQCNQKNIRLVVMNNLLPSSIKMHLKFDLKGSTYKRKVNIPTRDRQDTIITRIARSMLQGFPVIQCHPILFLHKFVKVFIWTCFWKSL